MWRKKGIKKINGDQLPNKNWEAILVVPKESNRAFLLLPNAHKVLMKWNRSYWFGISIGLLSNAIQK
jgi:membrane-bound lytic murein transglycosylase B